MYSSRQFLLYFFLDLFFVCCVQGISWLNNTSDAGVQETLTLDKGTILDITNTRSSADQGVNLIVPGVGLVQGLRNYKTIKNRSIDAYLGLRYGRVSKGIGRFQRATRETEKGFVDARRMSYNCAQYPELSRLLAAELRGEDVDDCLTLNIFAPHMARGMPVIVFVHGEMLFDGSAEEGQPDYLLEHDVLLVSINYRLAPFGFLAALNDQLPGNTALSDLHLAMQWVHEYIGHFGGDASQVTLLGQAGGATLAHALSLSGKANGLFTKLILHSGTATNPYFIDDHPLESLTMFARFCRCPHTQGSLGPLINCLGSLRTSDLVRAFEQYWKQNEPLGISFTGGFKLVVGDAHGYLTQHPAALTANISVPLIIGTAKDAGAFILSGFYNELEKIESRNLSDYINIVLRRATPPQYHNIWRSWALREIFSSEQGYNTDVRSISAGLLELVNIILYREPLVNSIRLIYNKQPTYLYSFDYRGEHHRFGDLINPFPFGLDATLSDDSIYLFPYPEEVKQLNSNDKMVSRTLIAMWTNFATNGNPSINLADWPTARNEYGPFLRITNNDNILEVDQHIADGLKVPNLFETPTVTLTTRRPYLQVFNMHAPFRNPTPPTQGSLDIGRRTNYYNYRNFARSQNH